MAGASRRGRARRRRSRRARRDRPTPPPAARSRRPARPAACRLRPRPSRPGAMPSCAAPQVMRRCSVLDGGGLVHHDRGRPHGVSRHRGRRTTGAWPARGFASADTATAAVGDPRRASTRLMWLPLGTSPDQASPMRPSSPRESCRAPRQIQHRPQRRSAPEQVERLVDALQRQPMRDEPVERQPAVAVAVQDHQEVAIGPAEPYSAPITRRSIRGMVSAGSGSTAS